MIKLFQYQENALKKLSQTGASVLSICAGGGKTYTALEYIKRNPQFKRILIFTHGTKVLKSQWNVTLTEQNIDFSEDFKSNSKIIIGIPQSLKKKDLGNFDLIIVDEAHEFYFAKTVQDILEKVKPKSVLLLTATPSKFNSKGFSPVIIPGTEVYKAGRLTDTYFGLVTSSYKLQSDSFNAEREADLDKITNKETKTSLDALVKEMISRLKTVKLINQNPNVIHTTKLLKLNKFQEVFGKLEKTLIACRSIEQANVLFKLLLDNKVNTVLSSSESDLDSLEIKNIKEMKKLSGINLEIQDMNGNLHKVSLSYKAVCELKKYFNQIESEK